jgi:iron(III) transport system permease protein
LATGARFNPGPHQFHPQPDHFRAWARRRGHLFCRLSDVREIMRPVPNSTRPPEIRSRVATSFAVTIGSRSVSRQMPVPRRSVLVAAAALVFPVVSLSYWIVRGSSAGFDLPRMAETALTTLGVSAAGAALTLVLALPVGILAARHRGRVPRLLEGATWMGYSMPGVVVAVALVYFAVNHAFALYQQLPLLIFAYALLFLPAAVGSVRSAVAQSPPGLEEVGRSLGRTPPQVFTRVTLPLAFPGVAAGATLVFLTCMKELPVTLMLHPTGMETIAMRLWGATNVGRFAAAAPYAMMLIVLASVPAFVLGRKATAMER